MDNNNKYMSRDDVMWFLNNFFNNVELKKKWGSIKMTFQNGKLKTIEPYETIREITRHDKLK